MRLLIVSVLLAALVTPAMAQGKGRKIQEAEAPSPQTLAKKKAADAAYQRALKSIPEPKGVVDPWQGAR